MKKLLPALLLLLTAACTPKDVLPDLGGIYQIAEITKPGNGLTDNTIIKMPYLNPNDNQTYVGTIVVVRQGDSRISVAYSQGVKDRPMVVDTLGRFSLKSVGSGYDMYDGSTKVGTVDSHTFDYYTEQTINNRASRYGIKATK